MHEMALAGSIRDIIDEVAHAHGDRRVERVVLEIGELAAVEISALRFGLEVALKDSFGENAIIDIIAVAGSGWCMRCATTVALPRRDAACPQCGSYQIQPTVGTEMRVKELMLAAVNEAAVDDEAHERSDHV
ncbi:putative hydrogenase nickel incorporation protein HypA [Betaproteobacteria bacterium]|nr:putative hydrogenase nickel incorporation protein HypA [Betaproteobacteria bacterium]